jgi:hypothetical protein
MATPCHTPKKPDEDDRGEHEEQVGKHGQVENKKNGYGEDGEFFRFNGDFFLNFSNVTEYWEYNFHIGRHPDETGAGNCYTFNKDGHLFQTEPNLEGGLWMSISPQVDECLETKLNGDAMIRQTLNGW